MKKVKSTAICDMNEGFADQITMVNGHLVYTGINSLLSSIAKEKGYEVKRISFFGSCIYININERALEGFLIKIDGVSVADFKDKIATEEERLEFSEELMSFFRDDQFGHF